MHSSWRFAAGRWSQPFTLALKSLGLWPQFRPLCGLALVGLALVALVCSVVLPLKAKF